MLIRHRKKRYALLAFLLGIYGVAFVTIVFKEDRDGKNPSSRVVDAHAENITCTRNWFVLGATWNCRATIVTLAGKRYPYSSFASALTPDDIGHPVEMTKTNAKGESRYFTPTRPRSSMALVYLPGFIASAILAFGGPILLWPRRDKEAFAAMAPVEKLARARILRAYSWTLVAAVGAVVLALIAAHQFLPASAAKWFVIPIPLFALPAVLAIPGLRMVARDYESAANPESVVRTGEA
ncbi:MAG: hypothetical protein ABIQ18_07170 [Umezawaea sp.]